MATRTYTVLVTITDEKLPTVEDLATQIKTDLEQGGTVVVGYEAAEVDAIGGDHVHQSRFDKGAAAERITKIKLLHSLLLR